MWISTLPSKLRLLLFILFATAVTGLGEATLKKTRWPKTRVRIELNGGVRSANSKSSKRTSDARPSGRPKKVRRTEFGNIQVLQQRKIVREEFKATILDVLSNEIRYQKDLLDKHMKSPIHRPESVTDDEHSMRQLCRMAYHLKSPDDDGNYQHLVRIYNAIYTDFMSGKNQTVDNSDDHQYEEPMSDALYGDLFKDNKDASGDDGIEIDDMSIHLRCHQIQAKRCDKRCLQVDARDAANIRSSIIAYGQNTDVTVPLEASVKTWITRYKPCFQGLRALATKLQKIENVQNAIEMLQASSLDEGVEKFIDTCKLSGRTKMKLWRTFELRIESEHHVQANALDVYGAHIEKFNAEMEKKRDGVCVVCNMMSCKDHFQKMTRSSIKFALPTTPEDHCMDCGLDFTCNKCANEKVPVCRICIRHIRLRKVPPCARSNELYHDQEPEELSTLNCIEKMLIKKVRVLQTIINLKDVGNRTTNMKGCGGAMAVVPTCVEKTVNHVVSKLPSAEHMKIIVNSNWSKQYLVCMDRVVKALEWLKCNNPEYKDVHIVHDFRFKIDEDIKFEDSKATQKDADQLIRKKESTDKLMLKIVECVEPLQKVNQPAAPTEPLQKYQLQKNEYKPITKEDPKTDLLAFVDLFPKGRGGMHTKRHPALKPFVYLKSVLLNAHRLIATNIYWLCYQYAFKTQKSIASCQGVQARIQKGKALEEFDLNDPETMQSLSAVFRKVRGFKQYWLGIKNRLNFQIALFGPPTWFLTLNPNEREWADLHKIYTEFTGRQVDGTNIRAAIEQDPVLFSRYWRRRVDEFFRTVLLVKDGPLGDISHYFWRVEYQHRGTQHVHCLLWSRNAPQHTAPEQEIASYIDRYVTARMPDESETELHRLVKEFQIHADPHLPTCARYKRIRGKSIRYCRFNFPRPVTPKTIINKSSGIKQRFYDLARGDGEKFVNDYSPALLLGWKGNVDVQYVGADRDVITYVTAYTTKGEVAKKLHEMKSDKCESRSKAIFALGIDEMNSRQVGALEIVDDLLGHPCFGFDQAEVWIPTDPLEKRSRMLKPRKELESTSEVFRPNAVDCYYPKRSHELEGFCLYNVLTNYEATSRKVKDPTDTSEEQMEQEEEEASDYHNGDQYSPFFSHNGVPTGTGLAITGSSMKFQKRKQKIGRFYIPEHDTADAEQVEDFYRRMCMLFIPWRNEAKIGEEYGQETYYGTFMEHLNNLKSQSPNAYDDLVNCISSFKDMKQEKKNARMKSVNLQKAMAELSLEDSAKQVQLEKRNVDALIHQDHLSKMNEQQQTLYDRVMEGVSDQKDQLLIYASGTAGVGKTFVIERIADELCLQFGDNESNCSQPPVLLSAPTGLAALSIRGLTLHSLLLLDVQNRSKYEGAYEPLRDDQRDMLRFLFAHLKLLIIDEISMVSAVMLTKIHYRLQEISGNNKPFGGFNIIVFGDLLQLPPVSPLPVFKGLDLRAVWKTFGGCGVSNNYWHCFQFYELTKNMRQREDLIYAELLGRLRINEMNSEDQLRLCSRIINTPSKTDDEYHNVAKYYVELSERDPYVMALFPRKAEVKSFNNAILKYLGSELITIKASDTSIKPKPNVVNRPYQRKEFSLIHSHPLHQSHGSEDFEGMQETAGGLPSELTLAINCRVMLRRNIDPVKGLMNGLTGVLEDVRWKDQEVDKLGIRFDRFPEEVLYVKKYSSMYEVRKGHKRSRTQFPIELSFAATIHKAQGLTLENVLVSTRNIFGNSQFYVAASRVKTLEGLHLLDYCAEKITIDVDALTEYDRLRGLDVPLKDVTFGSSVAAPSAHLPHTSAPFAYHPLCLINTGTDCFVNVVVEMMNSIDAIRMNLLETPVSEMSNQMAKNLRLLLDGSLKKVGPMRQLMTQYLREGQHDVKDAYEEIFNCMSDDSLAQMQLLRNRFWACPNCGKGPTKTTGVRDVFRTLYRSTSLHEIMTMDSSARTCTRCFNATEVKSLEYCPLPTTNNIMCRLWKTDSNQTIVGDISREITLDGAKWRIASMIEYEPTPGEPYGSKGHYVFWKRMSSRKWTRVSNDYTSNHRNPDLGGIDAVLLCLERI